MIDRRGFVCIIGGLIAAPAIVRAESIMAINPMLAPSVRLFSGPVTVGGWLHWWSNCPLDDMIDFKNKRRLINFVAQPLTEGRMDKWGWSYTPVEVVTVDRDPRGTLVLSKNIIDPIWKPL